MPRTSVYELARDQFQTCDSDYERFNALFDMIEHTRAEIYAARHEKDPDFDDSWDASLRDASCQTLREMLGDHAQAHEDEPDNPAHMARCKLIRREIERRRALEKPTNGGTENASLDKPACECK